MQEGREARAEGREVRHAERVWNDYVQQRTEWEQRSSGNLENAWNGRPISKLMLRHPLPVSDSASVPLIELIPPYHQRIYKMGPEHIGFVVGDDHEQFIAEHLDAFTGRQFQSPVCSPAYILFDDYTHVKFYRWSLGDVCEREGQSFESFQHADWPLERQASDPYHVVDGWTA